MHFYLWFMIIIATRPSNLYSDRLLNRLKKSSFCRKRRLALSELKTAAKLFWIKANTIPSFNKLVNSAIIRIPDINMNKIYNYWLGYIISLSIGEPMIVDYNNLEVIDFLRSNAESFYFVMQNISQYIDFSNKLYKPMILKLITELVDSLATYDYEYRLNLPVFDRQVIEMIISMAKKIGYEIKKNNLQFVDPQHSTQEKIGSFLIIAEYVMRNLDDNWYVKQFEKDNTCTSNFHSSKYFYNYKESIDNGCINEWITCKNVIY